MRHMQVTGVTCPVYHPDIGWAPVFGRSVRKSRGGRQRSLCLGALTYGEATGYDIKKFFESSFSHCFLAGYGSIYPALAELTAAKLVTTRTVPGHGGPSRKIYRLTDAGRKAFLTQAPGDRTPAQGQVRIPGAHALRRAPAARAAEHDPGRASRRHRTAAEVDPGFREPRDRSGSPSFPGRPFRLRFRQGGHDRRQQLHKCPSFRLE